MCHYQRVLSAFLPLLSNIEMQRGAARALEKIAEPGDLRVVSNLLPLLEGPDADVAASALEELAPRGDRRVVSELLPLLHNGRDGDSQDAAASALSKIAWKGVGFRCLIRPYMR